LDDCVFERARRSNEGWPPLRSVVSPGRLAASASGLSPGTWDMPDSCHGHRRTFVRSTERDHMSITLDNHLVDQLAGSVTGSVLAPDHAGYDAARAVHNGLVDRKPALIVRARSVQDVVAALAFARSGSFEVSVRGGGHNVAGRAVSDGGVMIDLA